MDLLDLFIPIVVFVITSSVFVIVEKIESYKEKNNPYRKYLIENLQIITSNTEKEDSKEKEESPKDIIALMLKNNDELTEYFQISKSQSRWSFWISTLACISGIIILGFTVYFVIIFKKTDIAVVGIISGAITELIAGTIFWLHNKSALQLNHYYDALHENEKVLLAINLTNTLSPEERENMCKEIIRTQIYKQKSNDK